MKKKKKIPVKNPTIDDLILVSKMYILNLPFSYFL